MGVLYPWGVLTSTFAAPEIPEEPEAPPVPNDQDEEFDNGAVGVVCGCASDL